MRIDTELDRYRKHRDNRHKYERRWKNIPEKPKEEIKPKVIIRKKVTK